MTDELTQAERMRVCRAAIASVDVSDDDEQRYLGLTLTEVFATIERILADRLAVARAETLTEAAEQMDYWIDQEYDDGGREGYGALAALDWLRARAAAVARDTKDET